MSMMTSNLALLFVFRLAPVQFGFRHRQNLFHCFSEKLGCFFVFRFIGFHVRLFVVALPIFENFHPLFVGRVFRKFSAACLQIMDAIQSMRVTPYIANHGDTYSDDDRKHDSSFKGIVESEYREHGAWLSVGLGVEV